MNRKSPGTKTFLNIALICFAMLAPQNVKAQNNQSVPAQKFDPAQPKFALLVGITNYKNSSINKIDGCENNVPLLAETLVKDYGFSEKNVVTLLDEKATKDAIITNFQTHLTENAKKAKADKKEAVIVYYFCGHGSQYADQDEDENDGLDETFVAYDSRTKNVFDILDDELDDLKSELRPFTTNTTLILESCHSGTGSKGDFRDEQYITQETDNDSRKRPPYKRKYKPTQDSDADTYTEIAASLSSNTAKSESKQFCNCEKPQSLMTKALIQALKRATHNTTYRGLVREIGVEVSERSRQEPQVEGNRDALLFGGAARRAKPYIEIEKLLSGNQMVIKAGAIHGLKEGSQVSVYSSDSLTNAGREHWLGNGIVRQVGNVASVVQLADENENPQTKNVKITSHVVLASPVFGGGSITLVMSGDAADEKNALIRQVEKKLSSDRLFENQILRLAADEAGAMTLRKESKGIIRLKKGKVKDAFAQGNLNKEFPLSPTAPLTFCEGNILKINSPEKRFPAADAEVYYLDEGESGGAPLYGLTFDAADETSAARISDAIRNFAYQQYLLGIDNAASTLSDQIKVSLQYVPSSAVSESCNSEGRKIYKKNGLNSGGLQLIKDNRLAVNSFFRLSLKNISGEIRKKADQYASGEAFHIAVINLTNTGAIKNAYASKGANEAVQDGREVEVFVRLTEPLGVERFIIVISKDYFDFSFYETPGNSKNTGFDLGRMLTQSGTKTKNANAVIKNEPDQWDVIHVDIKVVQ